MPSKSKAKKPRSPARKDPLIRRFETGVGEDELRSMMAYSGDPRAQRLLEMLMDPAYRGHTLAKLCEKVGLKVVDLLDLFRKFKWDVGTIDLYQQLPQIVKELAADAKSSQAACKRCDGEGKLNLGAPEEKSCPQCDGTGQVRVPGDQQAARLILQITGMIGRNRAPEIRKIIS